MTASPAPVVVIGGGIGGLVAAQELARYGVDVEVYEAGPRLAGMAATHVDPDGFSYDVGAHFVTNRFLAALGMQAAVRTVPHYGETVFLGSGDYAWYPFGLLETPRFVRGAIRERLRTHLGAPDSSDGPESAATRFRRDYGVALADEVALPLVEAWSGLPAEQLAPSVIDKIPTSVLRTIWLRAAQRLTKRAVSIGYCKEQRSVAGVFHVFPEGGAAAICQHVANGLPSPVKLDHPAERIYVENERVVGARIAGEDIATDTVITTVPIHRLPQLVEGTSRLDRFADFRFRGLVLVNLKLEGRDLLPDTIVWTPKGFPYFRVTEAVQSMPWSAPAGKTMILCELGAQPGDDVWTRDDDELVEQCVGTLDPLIPDVRRRLLGARVLRQPLAYPVFALDYEADRADLAAQGTGIAGLHSVGRNGEFDHILMEDIFWRLRRRAPMIAARHRASSDEADSIDLRDPVAG